MRRVLPFCAFSLVLAFGCSGSPPAPPQDTPENATAAEPSAPATASAVATAKPGEPPPAEIQRIAIDAQATLARLPEKAAIYGWARPASADALLTWTERPNELRRTVAEVLPEGSLRAFLEGIGVAPGAPIAFAITGPARGPAEKIVKSVANGKTIAAATKDRAAKAHDGLHVRLVARAANEADIVSGLARRSKSSNVSVVRCPDDKLCATVGSDVTALLVAREWAGAIRVEGTQIEIDAVVGQDIAERKLQAVAAKRKVPAGGPKARCAKLDPEADLSVCVDAEQTAELGAAVGLYTVLSAVSGVAGVDDSQLRAIVKQGLAEAMRNIELAKPKRRLVDDGTVNIRVTPEGYSAVGSWELTPTSKAGVEKSLAEPKCVTATGIERDLVPLLSSGFGDPGSDFKQLDERLHHVIEAGLAGLFVIFARSWPNFMAVSQRPGVRLEHPLVKRVCAVTAAGRLELEATGAKVPIERW